MRIRWLCGLALVAALTAPASALANGDPASDVLPFRNLFLPNPPPSSDPADELEQTLAAATKAKYRIRVAVIASIGDLGLVGGLWRKPQQYAEFLWREISYAYSGRLLIAMPNGFGYYARGGTSSERRVLRSVSPGSDTDELTGSAADAVRALAAAAGKPLPQVRSTSDSAWRDRLLIAAAAALLLIGAGGLAWQLRARRA